MRQTIDPHEVQGYIIYASSSLSSLAECMRNPSGYPMQVPPGGDQVAMAHFFPAFFAALGLATPLGLGTSALDFEAGVATFLAAEAAGVAAFLVADTGLAAEATLAADAGLAAEATLAADAGLGVGLAAFPPVLMRATRGVGLVLGAGVGFLAEALGVGLALGSGAAAATEAGGAGAGLAGVLALPFGTGLALGVAFAFASAGAGAGGSGSALGSGAFEATGFFTPPLALGAGALGALARRRLLRGSGAELLAAKQI